MTGLDVDTDRLETDQLPQQLVGLDVDRLEPDQLRQQLVGVQVSALESAEWHANESQISDVVKSAGNIFLSSSLFRNTNESAKVPKKRLTCVSSARSLCLTKEV